MTEAFVYDAIRTPRGRGKKTGSLHEVKPISLVTGLIDEIRKRNPTLDPDGIDDLVLGCVSPVGDQGADIAKTAALAAGLPDTVAGVQLNRFCASGLEAVNQAVGARPLRLGGPDPRRRRRVDEPRADGLRRRRLGDGPPDRVRHRLRAPGHRRRPHRDDRGLQPHSTSTRSPPSRRRVPPRRSPTATSTSRSSRSRTPTGLTILDHDEFVREGTTAESLGRLPAVVRADRRPGRLRLGRAREVPLGREDQPRPPRRQLLGHRRRRRAGADRQRGRRRAPRPQAARPHRVGRGLRLRARRSC